MVKVGSKVNFHDPEGDGRLIILMFFLVIIRMHNKQAHIYAKGCEGGYLYWVFLTLSLHDLINVISANNCLDIKPEIERSN